MDGYRETIFDDLQEEWERLRSSGVLDRAWARWGRADARLDDFADIGQMIRFLADRGKDHDDHSEVLLALLTAARDDRLAARVVLHRFVPALKRVAAWDQPFAHADWAAHVVAEAFEVIATYPIERRPRKVAANIVMDVRKRMYALLSEYRSSQAELVPNAVEGREAAAPGPADQIEAAQLINWARCRTGLPRDVAQLIVLTRLVGFTVKEVAQRVGVPPPPAFASAGGAARSGSVRRCRSSERLSRGPLVSGLSSMWGTNAQRSRGAAAVTVRGRGRRDG